MKTLLYSFLFLFLFGNGAAAQSKQKPMAKQTENGLLWQISGNGLKAPSYLFGTYHFAGKSFVDSLGYVLPKFKGAKAVVGEAIINQADMVKYMGMMTMDNNNTLDKIFTAEEFRQIVDANKRLTGMDITPFNSFKPAALQTFWLAFVAQRTITQANQAMDVYFQEEGKKLNSKVIGLETLDEQMNLLLNGPMENQKKHLLSFAGKVDKFKVESQKLYKLYQQQDLAGLSNMMFDTDEYSQAEMDDLLKNRNLRWIQKLPDIINEQPAFIAVGAGHLVGEFGLINQLRLKGYTVTPVRN